MDENAYKHPIASVSGLYRAARRPIKVIPLASPELKELYQSHNRLRYACSDSYENDFWSPIKRIFRIYEHEHVLNPLRFDSMGSLDGNLFESWRAQYDFTDQVYPGISELVKNFFIAFDKCLAVGRGPLLEEMLSQIGGSSDDITVVVLKKTFLETAYKSLTREGLQLSPEQVITPREIRDKSIYKRLFILSNPFLLKKYDVEWILSTPRGSTNTLITFDFFDYKWRPTATFPSLNHSFPTEIELTVSRGNTHKEEEIAPIGMANDDITVTLSQETTFNPGELDHNVEEQLQIHSKSDEQANTREDPESAPSYLFFLHGDKGVWLEENNAAYVINIEPGVQQLYGSRLDVNEISEGMFFLYRIEEGDFVPAVADDILVKRYGHFQPFRSAQRKWKYMLKSRITIKGMESVIRELKEGGCEIANIPNLRYWVSDRSLRTKNPRDFGAILALIGLKDDFDDYWSKMGILDTAHRQAGKDVARRLRDAITTSNASEEMLRLGYYEFDINLPNIGTLVAREVTSRSQGVSDIQTSNIGKVFDLEEIQNG